MSEEKQNTLSLSVLYLHSLRRQTSCFFLRRLLWVIWFCFGVLITHSSAQSISGYIYSEDNEPIPFANLYVQQLQSGTAANADGYFFLTLDKGDYDIIISAVGYQNLSLPLIIGDDPATQNFVLKSSSVELNEVVVKASKRDPAYAIIQKAIDHKKKFLTLVESFRSQVYVKATEKIEDAKKRKKIKPEESSVEAPTQVVDPFATKEQADAAFANSLNMVEMQLTLNYQAPGKYKEERNAYKAYGSQDGLFIPVFGQSDFNFYKNLVVMKGIAEVPLISPISRTAVLSYKFKLESSLSENGQIVHKIKVTPRKVGNSTFKGYIYINEGIWNINRLDLELYKGALKLYDQFKLKQSYQQINDTLWMPIRQELNYETKQGKYKKFRGNTLIRYSDFETNYAFPPKFFGNEVSVISQEAFERDSAYWQASRPEALTADQQRVVTYRDSMEAIQNSKPYLDSVQAAFNKVTFLEVIWDGVGFRNNDKKRNIYIGSLAAFIDFEVIGGFRLGPFVNYFRRYENGRRLFAQLDVDLGLANRDLQGTSFLDFRYNPHRLADISVFGGRTFESINNFDAFINQLRSSNYILKDHFGLRHRIELFNGFYFVAQGEIADRSSVENYSSNTFLTRIFEDRPPIEFEDYQAFITTFRISYTPRQKFMTEPTRKVILGSKYPTFSVGYKKGWDGPLSSDIDFDFIDFKIEQDLVFGTLGNSKYTLQMGTFTNTTDLRVVDLKRFRQSDPIWYSNPLGSFQSLDTALVATDLYFEFHHIHHFNGALVNNIPLVKKLRVRAVAGGGFLWLKEGNFRHEEIFAGMERVFKLGPRRRLRVGTYAVFSNSNAARAATNFKISLDLIDTWKKNWDF